MRPALQPLLALIGRGAILALLIGFSPRVLADGGFISPGFVEGENEVFVDMVGQRALLWIRSYETELWLQDRFVGNTDSFGWVIPVPRVPKVECVDERVLDGLDYETSAMFRETYWTCGEYTGCGFGCGTEGNLDGILDVSVNDTLIEDDAVDRWSSGSAGCLDYAVISSDDSDALLNWLEHKGLSFDDNLVGVFDDYSARGYVFLAAFVTPEPGRLVANRTVRITWRNEDEDPIVYPLYLTGATALASVDVKLFIAADHPMLPLNYNSALVPHVYPSARDLDDGSLPFHSSETYQEAYGSALSQAEGRTFVLTYVGKLTRRYGTCLESDSDQHWGSSDDCRSAPGTPNWLDDLHNFSNHWSKMLSDQVYITRLQASLTPEQMDEDLYLEVADVEDVIPSYQLDHLCGVPPPDSSDGGGAMGAIASHDSTIVPIARLLFVAIVAAMVLLRRGRRLAGVTVIVLVAVGCNLLFGGDEGDEEPLTRRARDAGEIVGDGQPGELCDGEDNDGDGLTDEDWPGLGRLCVRHTGACTSESLWICASDGRGMTCPAQEIEPSSEICNGLDDNCNGICDDGFDCCASVQSECNNPCGHEGTTVCTWSCLHEPCVPLPVQEPETISVTYEIAEMVEIELDGEPPSSALVRSPGELRLINSGEVRKLHLPANTTNHSEMTATDVDADGLDELVFTVLVYGDAGAENALSFYEVEGDELREIIRIGGSEGAAGGASYVPLQESVDYLGIVQGGTPEERLILTLSSVSTEDETRTLSRFRVVGTKISIQEPIADVRQCEQLNGKMIADIDGDGLDDALIHCKDSSEKENLYLLGNPELNQEGVTPVVLEIDDIEKLQIIGMHDLDHDGENELVVVDHDDPGSAELCVVEYPAMSIAGCIEVVAVPDVVSDLDGDGYDELAALTEPGIKPCQVWIATEPLLDETGFSFGPIQVIDFNGSLLATWKGARNMIDLDYDALPGRDLAVRHGRGANVFGSDSVGIALSPAGCKTQ